MENNMMEKQPENNDNIPTIALCKPASDIIPLVPVTEKSDIVAENNIKPKAPKAKKRKKPRDSTAPRQPLSGYIRYINDRREALRTSNPALSFIEITKSLASEWTNLAVDKKQQYLDAAELDKERYSKEYEAYKLTDAYKQFTQQQQNEKKLKEQTKEKQENVEKVVLPPVPPAPVSTVVAPTQPPYQPVVVPKDPHEMEFSNFDIPIFTEEFLEHNKTRDTELRQLRKINTDYEQQNAILTKHIENMKSAIIKLETEIVQQEKTNSALQQHLEHLRTSLSGGFSGTKISGIKESPSLQNIDEFMTSLHTLLIENNSRLNQDTKLLQTVQTVVAKLEFNG